VEQLGGSPTPAIGCAIGMERLVELCQISNASSVAVASDLYIVAVGEGAVAAALRLGENLRDRCPELSVEMNCGGGGFKAQMRRADASGAAVALILGDDEVASESVGIKPLRQESEQVTVAWSGVVDALKPFLQ
jgi:histidyl-tRNA synthetase